MKSPSTTVKEEILLKGNTQVIDGHGLTGKSNTLAILRVGQTPIVLLASSEDLQQQWIKRIRALNEDMDSQKEKDILFLDAFNDPTVASNIKGVIIGFNNAAEKMFAYKKDEIIGKNVKILMPETYDTYHDRYLSRYLQSQEKRLLGCPRALIAITKAGVQIPITLSLGEMESNDGSKYYVAMFKQPSGTHTQIEEATPIDTHSSPPLSSCPHRSPEMLSSLDDDHSEDLSSTNVNNISLSTFPLGHIRMIGELDDAMDRFKSHLTNEWHNIQSFCMKQQKMIDTLMDENRRLQGDLSQLHMKVSNLEDIVNRASLTSTRFKCSQLLNHDACYPFFLEYCRQKQCEELCMFYHDVQLFRKKYRNNDNDAEMKKDVLNLQQRYLPSSSAHEINIPAEVRIVVLGKINTPISTLFDTLADDVLSTLHTNHYEQFIRTGAGKACLAQLQMSTK